MGFFNKILKGLGFEDEETIEEKKPKQKEKKQKAKTKVIASYDLNKFEEELNNKREEIPEKKEEKTEEEVTNPSFIVVKVSQQENIQEVIDKIKTGQKVIVNIEDMAQADITRSLDFLTGAVYALNLTMEKLDNKIYLIQ